ncbi:CaiB/BaiF CoA-transferase family protein [Pseudonocardia xishanensis]|uniref:CaiB/BaiF CoA-transferase family protein n=1 Tax=Pseudonocardia xishanensis TaxID=630995 RepID=A0ABP8RWX6_9PSEU
MEPVRREGPLTGLRVVELAAIGPVPFAGMTLAQMGATVTVVERPSGLDSVIPTDADAQHADKRRSTLDLRSAEGAAALLDLVAEADVLLEGHRPGVLERLGLGPDVLSARNPALVVGRMTGWGQDGPLARSAGHDVNYIGVTGALHAVGPADGPPQIPLNLVGDYGGGALYLLCGVLAALHERTRTGRGQVVDAAIVDGAAHLLSGIHSAMAAGLWQDRRGANFADGGTPWYAVYRTSDDGYMSVSAVEQPFYLELLRLLDLERLGPHRPPERWAEIRAAFAEAFARCSRAGWTERAAGTDACVAPVLSLREAAGHPHLSARGTVREVDGRIVAAPAPRFSAHPSTGSR